jgi:hypothetical protein
VVPLLTTHYENRREKAANQSNSDQGVGLSLKPRGTSILYYLDIESSITFITTLTGLVCP